MKHNVSRWLDRIISTTTYPTSDDLLDSHEERVAFETDRFLNTLSHVFQYFGYDVKYDTSATVKKDFSLDFDNDAQIEKALSIVAKARGNPILRIDYFLPREYNSLSETRLKTFIASLNENPNEDEARQAKKALEEIKPLVDELAAELGLKHISPKGNIADVERQGFTVPRKKQLQ